MNIKEIDFTNGKKYRDTHGFVWTVEGGELVDNGGINIHYSYTVEEIVNNDYTKEV